MKLPIAWLRDYVDVALETDAIAERFASLGFPVDDVVRRPRLSGVVVGRLTKIEKHPNADKLQLCTVDVGGARSLTIATAATNVAEGNVVPVATIGAELVGMTIAPRKMRGIDSEGMLCSADEIGLPADWFDDGILQLETDLVPGTDFVEAYRLNDDVLDVEVTANRVDALSVLGLARELAASLGIAVREPAIAIDAVTGGGDVRVVLESSDCKRFVAQRVSNVRVGITPFWMRVRLALAGQRPIDGIVDISNFVMFETAQPLHFYDADALAGGLVVRDARPEESMRTLDGEDRTLDPRFLVIADEHEVQCIAGLKGAAPSEIGPATRALVIEAATFAGPRVRRMSVALGLRTEASTRQEKGLPLGLSTLGAARAAHLLQHAGATVHAPQAFGAADEPSQPIALTGTRVRALLGAELSAGDMRETLERLGFTVAVTGDALTATPPPWRGDVRIAEDVIEEIARVAGYDRIVAAFPPIVASGVSSDAYRTESRVAHALASCGYREAYTYSLQPGSVAAAYASAGVATPGAPLEIRNPLSEEQRWLRFALLPALLELAARHARDGAYRVFEVGHIFADAGEPFETPSAVWLLALPRDGAPAWRDDGFLTFKSESLAMLRSLTGVQADTVTTTAPGWHPGKTASLVIGGKDVATIGAVDPRLLAAFDVGARAYCGRVRMSDVPAHRAARYVAPSRFPAVARDLALVVADDLPAADIVHAARAAGNGAIADVRVFDEYRGPQIDSGKKSIAVRVTLQRADATLTDEESDRHVAAIVAALRERCGATMRA